MALSVLLCVVARATAFITMYDYNRVRYTHHESVDSLLRAAFTGDGVSLGNVVVGVILFMSVHQHCTSPRIIFLRNEREPPPHCPHPILLLSTLSLLKKL